MTFSKGRKAWGKNLSQSGKSFSLLQIQEQHLKNCSQTQCIISTGVLWEWRNSQKSNSRLFLKFSCKQVSESSLIDLYIFCYAAQYLQKYINWSLNRNCIRMFKDMLMEIIKYLLIYHTVRTEFLESLFSKMFFS